MKKINYWHTGFLTSDIEGTIASFSQLFGIEKTEPADVEFTESEMTFGAPFRIKVANVMHDGMVLELIQPVGSPDSYLAKELARRGVGVHHMAYATPGCYTETVDELISNGWILGTASCKGGLHNCFLESPDGAAVVELIERIPG